MADIMKQVVTQRIYAQATPVQAKALREESAYGTQYSFWRLAVEYGLAAEHEFEAAKRSSRDLWHYRGD